MVQLDLLEWPAELSPAEELNAEPAVPEMPPAQAIEAHDDDAAHAGLLAASEAAAAQGTLVFVEEAVDFQEQSASRTADTRNLLRTVQRLLARDKTRRKPAVCLCGYARGGEVSVHLVNRYGRDAASVTGVYRCGNGESCPHCAPIVAAARAKRYRIVHEAIKAREGRAPGGRLLTVTLTLAHYPDARLDVLLKAMKAASTGVRSGGFWHRKIRPLLEAAGALVDIHVRWSRTGGWHPHVHLTVACLTDDEAAITEGANLLINRYVTLLAAQGLHAGADQQEAVVVRNDPDDSGYAYPAHHHRPAEVEGDLRAGMDDDTSLSPFDIARLAADGDAEMGDLFVEFAQAMHGTKCAVITARMAQALGIEPNNDESPLNETTRLGTLPSSVWTGLLDRSLQGTFLSNVATFGRPGWRRLWWWAHEQTGHAPPVVMDVASEIMALLKAMDGWQDPASKEIGWQEINSRIRVLADRIGEQVAAATLDYTQAHWRFCEEADEDTMIWVCAVEEWGAKLARRRREQKQATPSRQVTATDAPFG